MRFGEIRMVLKSTFTFLDVDGKPESQIFSFVLGNGLFRALTSQLALGWRPIAMI